MGHLATPTALLFDWDNTLVNTWPIIHRALNDTLSKWQMEPWSLDEVKLRVGKSMRDAFPHMFQDEWEKAGAYYVQQYRAYHLSELEALPGALEVLEYLKQATPYIAVVSNKKGDTLRLESSHIGWDQYFSALVGANDAARDKPHADPAILALKGSDITMGEHVWFLGDTTTDLDCARLGGMTPILYGEVVPESDTLYRGSPYAHHVRDHTELLALLKACC